MYNYYVQLIKCINLHLANREKHLANNVDNRHDRL